MKTKIIGCIIALLISDDAIAVDKTPVKPQIPASVKELQKEKHTIKEPVCSSNKQHCVSPS